MQRLIFFIFISCQLLYAEEKCYDELGCFPHEYPWVSLRRPFPPPWSPERINVGLRLYTRNTPVGYDVTLWPEISLKDSDFHEYRRYTIFLTHGFASGGDEEWLHDLKDALLDDDDVNVFIVNWYNGSSHINYLQVASNTRIVGAELARFGKHLLQNGVESHQIHLIGHSLGSHISGYMAKEIKKDFDKIWRITALDPAQPGFEFITSILEPADPRIRLTSEDAEFIDVYHTDAKPFIPFFGFGMMSPVGHVDFYFNGGSRQPGCLAVDVPEVNSIEDLLTMPVEVIQSIVSCSHGRAYEILISTVKLKDCIIIGRKMLPLEKTVKISTLGTTRFADSIIDSIVDCDYETCTLVGLETPLLKARGNFAASTERSYPFCGRNTTLARSARNLLTKGILAPLSDAASTVQKVLGSKLRYILG